MKRSGGKAGRPMGQRSIQELEEHAASAEGEVDELLLIFAELGHRKSKRAAELKSLVDRLLAESRPLPKPDTGPLFR